MDENDFVIKWTKAKAHVSSNSVLCLGRVHQPSEANTKEQFHYFQQSSEYAELCGIDGEPIEFEWNISQDSRRLRLSDMFSKIWTLDE